MGLTGWLEILAIAVILLLFFWPSGSLRHADQGPEKTEPRPVPPLTLVETQGSVKVRRSSSRRKS